MNNIKEQLNETWRFISDMAVVSKYQNDGVVIVNTGAILNDITKRLKDIYIEIEKYEQAQEPTEESGLVTTENN